MDGLAAVVLAGGLGTRMRSARPKSLHPLLGLPLAAWPVRAAMAAGADPVVAVVSPGREDLQRALAASCDGAALRFAVQEEARGTADAVASARAATEGLEHVFLLYGDVPLLRTETLQRLVDAYRDTGETLALVTCVLDDGAHYGRILRTGGPDGDVVAIREARDTSPEERAVREVNVGAYLARRAPLFEALGQLSSDNAQGEFYLTDIVEVLVAAGRRVGAVRIDDCREMQGVNTRAELAAAGAVLRDRINRAWMANGVTFEDPATAWVEPDVQIGRDTTLGPGVVLRGATCVGAGCELGPGVVIVDTTVGEGTSVGAHSVLEGVQTPPGLEIPPISHVVRE